MHELKQVLVIPVFGRKLLNPQNFFANRLPFSCGSGPSINSFHHGESAAVRPDRIPAFRQFFVSIKCAINQARFFVFLIPEEGIGLGHRVGFVLVRNGWRWICVCFASNWVF